VDLTGALYWLVYGLLIVGACTDVLWLKIPNVLVGLVVLAFGAAVLLTDREISLASQIVPAIILLVGGAVLFYFGKLGGGDAKFLAATSLFVGDELMTTFLLWLALWGLVVALVFVFASAPMKWVFSRLSTVSGRKLFIPHSFVERSYVPYGVAITAAALMVLPDTPFFA
jgi:prepilin peptidase CpaA